MNLTQQNGTSVKIRFLEGALVALIALCSAACGITRDSAPPVVPFEPPPAEPAVSVAPPVEEAPPDEPEVEAPPALPSGKPEAGRELSRFHAALRGLEDKTRKRHVRVAWLGDSHGQADFWSGALRDALQAKFGKGGPGYLHVGYKGYRHEGVRLGAEGYWKARPSVPSSQSPIEDGVFGLGGVMTRGTGFPARVSVKVDDTSLPPKALVDVCYRPMGPEDRIEVRAAGSEMKEGAAEGEAPFAIRHLELTSDVPIEVSITVAKGQPRLCGVSIETDPEKQPGVLVDTLGINGARYGTVLAWNEDAWAHELSLRSPDLVVLEYGTNEAGARRVDPQVYSAEIGKIMDRVRKVSPMADCVVLSLTDRADTPDFNDGVRDAQKSGASQFGCAFFDTYQEMGGRGGIRRWLGGPKPLATKDGVHLTVRGYRELGSRLYEALIKGYSAAGP